MIRIVEDGKEPIVFEGITEVTNIKQIDRTSIDQYLVAVQDEDVVTFWIVELGCMKNLVAYYDYHGTPYDYVVI